MNEKETMHPESSNTINLPKRSKAKMVWMIIAIIALVALIGVSIYGYMQMQKSNQKIKDQQAQIDDLENKRKALEDAASAAAKAAIETVQDKNASYLKITQYGVELIPGPSISDLRYVMKAADQAIFESPSLNQKLNTNSTSATACGQGSLGSILRGQAGQQVLGTTFDKASGSVKVGDYYYLYQRPGSGCGGTDSNLPTLEKAWTEMADSMKTLRVSR